MNSLLAQETKIQSIKYQPFGQSKISSIKYNRKDTDSLSQNSVQSQNGSLASNQESFGEGRYISGNNPQKITNISIFSNNEGFPSTPQYLQKDNQFRSKRYSFGTPNHNYGGDNSLSYVNKSNIQQIVDDQFYGQTVTTNIIKNKQIQNIDFDLGRQVKGDLNNKDNTSKNNLTNIYKRKSVVELRNQAQYDLDQQQYLSQKSPQSNKLNNLNLSENKSNNYLLLNQKEQNNVKKRKSEIAPTLNGHTRFNSLDAQNRNQQNNVILPQLQSPSMQNQKTQNQPNQLFYSRETNLNNKNNTQQLNSSRPFSRNSFSSQVGDSTLNSSYNKKTNLPIKDIIQMQIEQKQSLHGGSSIDSLNRNNQANYFSGSKHFQVKDSNYFKQNINDRSSSLQKDEYLSNHRKSVSLLNNNKASNSNPSSPHDNNQNFNPEGPLNSARKQNGNSQFFSQKPQNQQKSSHKMNTIISNMDNFSNGNQKYENYFKRENESLSGIQSLDSQRKRNKSEAIRPRFGSSAEEQNQSININNIQSLLCLGNIVEQQQGNNIKQKSNLNSIVELGSIKSQNIENMNEVLSQPIIQPMTLTSINMKDYDAIKYQCIKLIENQIFSEPYHQSQFERVINVSYQEQLPVLIQFLTLCLEELQQEINLQIENTNPSFINLKDIDVPQTFSNTINNINIQWPQFPFKFPEKFIINFVERVSIILEQNEFLRKKITQLKKIVSHNFRKHLCYRDLINEIGGVHNISNIVTQIVSHLETIYKNTQLTNYMNDIKQFSINILEQDTLALDNLIYKHFNFQTLIQRQYSNDDTNTPKYQKIGSQSFNTPKNMISPKSIINHDQGGNLSFSSQQAKLTNIIGQKNRKKNMSVQNDIAAYSFNPKIFFNVKYSVYITMQQQEFVSSRSIMTLLETLELLRYSTFRQFFGHEVALKYSDHTKNIMNLIPDTQLVQLVGNENTFQARKNNYLNFFNQFCENILVMNSSPQKIKELLSSQKINLNSETLYLLENQMNYILGAMKIIPHYQRKDIKDKFQKLKRLIGVSDSFESIYDNIFEINQELQNFSDKQFTNAKQFSKENIADIKQSFSFFKYILEACLSTSSAFSYYDMTYAYSELNLKEEGLNFWIKSLKRILQKYSYKSSIINTIEQQLNEIVLNKNFN